MLFNSFEFLLFLPIVFFLYWFVCNKSLKLQNILLLAASYFFYGWWSWKFLGLLALSTALDYAYGFGVASANRYRAKLFLWLSIVNNLGILALFKYYNFFALEIKTGLDHLGLHTHPVLLDFALPIGISFYTFHGMSYVFDIYRGHQKPIVNIVDYSVFVSFFPLLVAGPIERANHLLPQVQKSRGFNYSQAVEGCRLILWGLFKKVIIADTLAITVDEVFNNYQEQQAYSLIIGVIAFSFQIYGDFSGYSDIALGTAKLFGFELLSNFRFPYFSRDVAEFWRRWHISLSSWFRDYLYIPLGGSREGKFKAVRNTFIIFLVSGFWHGASWTFIAWGFIHACGFLPLLLLNRNRQHLSDVAAQYKALPTFKELWQMLTTFVFISIAWIFFRADDLPMALGYISHTIGNIISHPEQFLHAPREKTALLLIAVFITCDWWLRRDERHLRTPANRILRIFIYILIVILAISSMARIDESSNFIYFQF